MQAIQGMRSDQGQRQSIRSRLKPAADSVEEPDRKLSPAAKAVLPDKDAAVTSGQHAEEDKQAVQGEQEEVGKGGAHFCGEIIKF